MESKSTETKLGARSPHIKQAIVTFNDTRSALELGMRMQRLLQQICPALRNFPREQRGQVHVHASCRLLPLQYNSRPLAQHVARPRHSSTRSQTQSEERSHEKLKWVYGNSQEFVSVPMYTFCLKVEFRVD